MIRASWDKYSQGAPNISRDNLKNLIQVLEEGIGPEQLDAVVSDVMKKFKKTDSIDNASFSRLMKSFFKIKRKD